MDKARGLPIAAYLGALVALALASAFVAVLAVVIWLPPRPPDVMRADEVAGHFQAGYDYMRVEDRPLPNDGMEWRVADQAPPMHAGGGHQIAPMRAGLAQSLGLEADQVRVAASRIERSDVFVFRVSDPEALHRDARRAAREARAMLRESRRAEIEARRGGDGQVPEARQGEVEAAREAREHALEALRMAREAGAGVVVEGDKIIIDAPSEVDLEAHLEAHGDHAPLHFEIRTRTPPPPAAPAPPRPARGDRRDVVAEVSAPDAPPPMFAPAPRGVALISGFEIGARLPDGRWLLMRQGRNWAELGWIGRAALILAGALAVLSLLAVLFARRLTRPIRSFADAVQAVGVNPQSEPVREEGPRELRGAARAVNTMQARLRALIADRTKTLAAVAHDMRTPLMRLRLVAENTPPEQRERLAKEIAEVEALVASFIAFARDDPAEEARVRIDLAALLQSLTDDHAESGRDVSFAGEERLIVTGQSLGLKRLFNNLIDNALKYGARARVSLKREAGAVIVDIADDGPGVAPGLRESVFEPFVRLDNGEARAGAGLGLPAARSIARAHGGDVVILDAEAGGLVRVTLPG